MHCAAYRKASSEADGSLQIELSLYTHRFTKRCAASLMDLPEFCLCLFRASFVVEMQCSNGSGFHKRVQVQVI